MANMCPICGSEIQIGVPVCPACGFKLVGTTQRFKPISIAASANSNLPLERMQSFNPSDISQSIRISPKASMDVVRGPQVGVRFTLGDERLVIGRDPKSEIFLNDMTVSRKHASIDPFGMNHQISDLNSFNGVWVNNRNVNAHILQNGDMVQIGAFLLQYHKEDQ